MIEHIAKTDIIVKGAREFGIPPCSAGRCQSCGTEFRPISKFVAKDAIEDAPEDR